LARKSSIAAAFVLLLALIAKPIWDGRQQWHWGQGMDDGVYWVTAKALASGQGYRASNLPGQPYELKFPPLYPLYLSLAWRLHPEFPANLRTAAGLQALLLPVYLALLLAVLRQFGFSWRRTFLVAALTIVTLQFTLLTLMLFSELLCGCFLLAAVLTSERAAGESESAARWWALASGLLTGLAYLTRSASLPMLIAIPIFFLIRKRSRLSVYALSMALPLAAMWHVWVFLHTRGNSDPVNTSYVNEYLRVVGTYGFWQHLVQQVSVLAASVMENFFPGGNALLYGLPFYNIVLIASVAGCIRLGRARRWPLYLIFTALYLVLIVAWWSDGLSRLVLPVWPVLLAGIAEEASHVASLFAKSLAATKIATWQEAPRWALIAAGVGIIARSDDATWRRVSAVMASERQFRAQDQVAFSWVKEHAATDTVVATWKDSVSYLYTGVPSSLSLYLAVTPVRTDAHAFQAAFSTLPQRYRCGLLLLLRSDFGEEFQDRQLDLLRASAGRLNESKLEYASPTAFIYRFALR
jgi:hypothetical protein